MEYPDHMVLKNDIDVDANFESDLWACEPDNSQRTTYTCISIVNFIPPTII